MHHTPHDSSLLSLSCVRSDGTTNSTGVQNTTSSGTDGIKDLIAVIDRFTELVSSMMKGRNASETFEVVAENLILSVVNTNTSNGFKWPLHGHTSVIPSKNSTLTEQEQTLDLSLVEVNFPPLYTILDGSLDQFNPVKVVVYSSDKLFRAKHGAVGGMALASPIMITKRRIDNREETIDTS